MANAAADWNYEFFNVSFPAEYVAHVEINRQEKLNAFVEVYVLPCLHFHSGTSRFLP
jgi:hypothetical protein